MGRHEQEETTEATEEVDCDYNEKAHVFKIVKADIFLLSSSVELCRLIHSLKLIFYKSNFQFS